MNSKRYQSKLLLLFIISVVSCQPSSSGSKSGGGITSGRNSPTTPHLSLSFPDSTNADSSSLSILASSVDSGNTVKLYSDNECSVEVSSEVASASSVVFNLDSLHLGVHQFFTTQETSSGKRSPCSEIPLTYVYENQAPNYMDSITTSSPQPTAGTTNMVEITLTGVTYGHTMTLCADSNCSEVLGTVVADSDSVTFSVALAEFGDYTFYAQSTNNFGSTAITEVYSYSYGTIPSAPTFARSGSSGLDSTPSIEVTGVSSGDLVKIFSDSSCTIEMGSATSTGSSVFVTSSQLNDISIYFFYANSTNEFGTSPCSSDNFSYDHSMRQNPVEPPEENPTIAVADLPTKRLNFVDCGENQNTLAEKITECGLTNNGASVDAGNGKIWKLVTRISTDELWLDNSTGLVWSPTQVAQPWNTAVSFCSGLSSYSISNESWYLPSDVEMETARLNGYAGFIDNPTVYHWSSYEIDVLGRLLRWSDGSTGYGMKTNSSIFRCVFDSAN